MTNDPLCQMSWLGSMAPRHYKLEPPEFASLPVPLGNLFLSPEIFAARDDL